MKQKILSVLFIIMICGNAMARGDKHPSSYNYLRGREAALDKNYEEAMKYLEKEKNENPRNGYAYVYLSRAYCELEQYDDAITAARNSLRYLPKNEDGYRVTAHKTLVYVYACLERFADALDEIAQVEKIIPQDDETLSIKAGMKIAMKDYEGAMADYQQVLSVNPGRGSSYLGLGQCQRELGQYDQAIESLTQAISLDYNIADAYQQRAQCYMATGDHQSAARDLVSALDCPDEDNVVDMYDSMDEACYQHMITLMQAKAENKQYGSMWRFNLGLMHMSRERYVEAIEQLDLYMQSDHDPQMYPLIVRCYKEAGDFAHAQEYIDMMCEIDSTSVITLESQASLCYYQGQFEEAVRYMTRCIENSEERSYYYHYLRGHYSEYMHDVENAIRDYTYSIALEPTYAPAYQARADIYTLQGDTESAARDYAHALQYNTTILSYGNCRQFAFLALEQADSALFHMQRILDTYPNNSNYYDAACLMCRMGHTQQALEYLRTSFQLGFRKFHFLEVDDDMNPIRQTDEYKALLSHYQGVLQDEVGTPQQPVPAMSRDTVISEISFTGTGRMMHVRCTINQLPLNFIFDTGCTTISISQVEADFMLKNGYLSPSDVKGTSYSVMADGGMAETTDVILRSVNIGGIELKNMKAVICKNQSAPLLLGQSVFGRMGQVEIDNEHKIIRITHTR